MPLLFTEPAYVSWVWGAIMFLLKTLFVIFLMIVMKSAVARIRTDQMISLAYKWLIPLALIQIFIAIMVRFIGGI
jgi:NADH-quinone oxidoreductase subunit H